MDSSISWLPASQLLPFGTCIVAEGILREPSSPGKHVVELKTEKLLHIGTVDPDKYPLSKKQLPLHVLRDHSHFRPRTTTVICILITILSAFFFPLPCCFYYRHHNVQIF